MDNKTAYERLADFILNKSTHRQMCPKYVRTDKECKCGLDEIRLIAENGHA